MWRNRAGASFLTRLGRDIRGNTLAIAAAAMIPLAGLIGGGVDMSRLYLTKTRLQQACDAGALAGRKAMGSGSWTTGGTTSSQARANELFAANFRQNAYGTGTLTQSFTESSGTVSGTASVTVPMTIMRVFGMMQRNLNVNCSAKMEIPNTDVMFVLDVTGSMNCVAGDTSCSNNGGVAAVGSKIDGIKSAVKCFYEALMKVNTPEVCGSDPTATSYTQSAQIRFGFVPYSVNVNVGKLLSNSFMSDTWTYQSRQAQLNSTPTKTTSNGTKSSWSTYATYATYTNISNSSNCTALIPAANSAATGTESDPTNQISTAEGDAISWQTTTPYADYQYTSSYNSTTKVCTITRSQRTYTQTAFYNRFNTYIYKPVSWTVSGLKAGGSSWNGSVNLSIGTAGASQAATWDGCIEERQTVKNSDGDPSNEWTPIPTAAFDMDIDKLPSSSVTGTQWGPMLPDAVWGRYTLSSKGKVTDTTSNVTTTDDLSHNDYYVCPTQSKKLQTWYTSGDFVTYVNSLKADGNTYHDIGMIWGARFISPTGIFASENAQTPTGGAIQRHIIFMTDGDTNSQVDDYNAYGLPWWDRRQTTYEPDSTDNGNIINARLAAMCTAIKNKNTTLWVISYGGGINSTTETRLKTCASPNKYFSAANTTTLISNFKQIASEIAELRLTN